jgi:hypothetical protein
MQRAVLLLALACAAAGCETAASVGRGLEQGLNPFARTGTTVGSVAARGPYLEATLAGGGIDLRMLAPASESCAAILQPEATVTYAKEGVFGRVDRDDASCDLAGTTSLAAWRDRQPRSRGRPAPSATARFRVVHRDPEVVLVRGRFPLAGRAGIPGGFDLVAMLPASDVCRSPIERGEATLEFRDAGSEPFRLGGTGGFCPVLGFATPLPGMGGS